MAHQFDKCRSRAGRVGLLVALCLGLTLVAAGQGQPQAKVYHFSARSFEIPLERALSNGTVKQVLLHVSTNGGPYKQVAIAMPSAEAFTYNASADGWYSFVVQVEDVEGRLWPPDAQIPLVQPNLRVCVDTQRPQVILKPVLPRGGTAGVEWQISDKNLDLRTLQLAYRLAGTKSWIGLNTRPLDRGQFGWTPLAAGTYEVRLTISDFARNCATATTQVKVASGAPSMTANSSGQPPRIKHVRSKTFHLNYKIDNVGPSKVKKVEVWMTRDTRQWIIYKEDAPAQGPCELTVDRAGRYGFTLRPWSGVGRAPKPPGVNEPPQLWVQVDETKPIVKITRVEVAEGKDSGSFAVHYTATDPHLSARPIAVSYATTSTGPWTELVSGQENTGVCRCPNPRDLYEFHVRVEAVDEAGNKGEAVWKDTVKVDLKTPTVTDLSADPIDPAARRSP